MVSKHSEELQLLTYSHLEMESYMSGKAATKGAVMLPPTLSMAKQGHGPISICLSTRELCGLLCHGNPPKLLS